MTLTPLSLAISQAADANWEHEQDTNRFSRRSKRMNETNSAWLALSIGPLLEDRIRLTKSDRRLAKRLLLGAD